VTAGVAGDVARPEPSDAPAPTLTGRVVLVTGAGQGVGRGIALASAAAGASVVVTARRTEAVDEVVGEIAARGGEALGVACDVTDRARVEAAVAAAVERFGRLDAVVHNATSAGSSRSSLLEDVADDDWDDQVAVALRASFHLAQASRAALAATGGTLVVLVSTAAMEGSAPLPVYTAVKGAQRGFVKSLAREWGPSGIRVNALAPVAVSRAMADFLEREPEARERLAERAALRRLGEVEADIGRAVTFLLGPDSGFVTGQTLVVNGGAFLY
jgi:NAD(P)-dependent dehydrogenase (short-subunit alcohol dehydrogenase family)